MSPEQARQRVLVVDDTPETLALLTDALEEAGMTVLVSVDGASAILSRAAGCLTWHAHHGAGFQMRPGGEPPCLASAHRRVFRRH